MHTAPFFAAALLGSASFAAAQGQVDADGAPAPAPVSSEAIYDDLRQVTPAAQALVDLAILRGQDPLPSALPTEGGLHGSPVPSTGTVPAKQDVSNEAFSNYSVEGLLTKPLYHPSSEGDAIWSRVRRMKASFGADGFVAYPAFGKAAKESYAVHFELNSVTVGSEELPFGESAATSRAGDAVTLDRGTLREVYHVELDGIEQTFVFDDLPASGDLVLNIDVDSNLGATQDANGIHFVHETFGGITYGDAFVLDAAGRRKAIERMWTGDSIRLTVPASFLDEATFPITVDPPVTSFVSTAGTPDDSNPDVCFAAAEGVYWAVFQDYFDGTQSDVYAMSLDTNGVVVDFITIEFSTDDWTTPKIAYHNGANRCMVVASAVDTGGSGTVQGRLIDCATGFTTGTPFTISSIGALKVHPDVAGSGWDSTVNNYFLVTWSSVWNPGAYHQIQYRAMDWDGTPITGLESVTAANTVHNEPALSSSHGDINLGGDYWMLVWNSDADDNGLGDIMGRLVVWSGDPLIGAGTFTVASGGNSAHPRVTSRFNRPLLNSGERPSLVVYEREFGSTSTTSGVQGSIYGTLASNGTVDVESAISWELEDFDLELDQREPDVACDGNCFYLIYSELYYGNPMGTDFDMYMLSGCISDRLDGAEIALAERHDNMAFSGTSESNGSVATIWDGDNTLINDDGMAIWEDNNVTNGATIEGSTLEIPTANQSLVRAVGRQFCDNNPNSGGGQQGRQASWSWMLGNQSTGSTHTYFATDLPVNSFGYSVISMVFADINHPAGSLGRVCVPGGGRYVDQIASSGATGTLSTTITPMNVPSPTGFISMQVGETWGFQYWHRDIAPGGTPSSNFTTACKMQFTN